MSSLKEKNLVPHPGKEVGKAVRKASDRKKLVSMLEEIPYENVQNVSSTDKLFTSSQIERILEMRYRGGKYRFFINLNDQTAYEFIGGCEKYRRNGGSIDDLISMTQDHLDEMKGDYNPIRDGEWFSKEREVYKEEIDKLKTTNTSSSGIYNCPRCIKNKEKIVNNTITEVRQTRAGDEALDIRTTCNTCGLSWTS